MKKTLLLTLAAAIAGLSACKKNEIIKPAATDTEELSGTFKKEVAFACPETPRLRGVLATGGNGVDFAGKLSISPAGVATVQGTFQGVVDFNPGSGVANLTGSTDDLPSTIYTQRLTSSGAFISAGKGEVFRYSMLNATDSEGFIYTARIQYNNGSTQHPVLLEKYQGITKIWYRSIGYATSQVGTVPNYNSVVVDKYDRITVNNGSGRVFRYNAEGVYAFAFDYEGKNQNVALDNNDNIYVFGGQTAVQKFSSAGSPGWKAAIPGVTKIAVDAAGSVYLTGSFTETGDFDPGPGVFTLTNSGNGNADLFVVKLNSDGQFVWAVQTKGEGTTPNAATFAYDIKLDPTEQNVVIVGGFEGKTNFAGYSGSWVLQSKATDSFILCYQQCK